MKPVIPNHLLPTLAAKMADLSSPSPFPILYPLAGPATFCLCQTQALCPPVPGVDRPAAVSGHYSVPGGDQNVAALDGDVLAFPLALPVQQPVICGRLLQSCHGGDR